MLVVLHLISRRNADKTEFIWLVTRHQLAKVNVTPLVIGDQSIMPL